MERKPYSGSSERARGASTNRPGSADKRTSASYARNSASTRSGAGEAPRTAPNRRPEADRSGATRRPAPQGRAYPEGNAHAGCSGYEPRSGSGRADNRSRSAQPVRPSGPRRRKKDPLARLIPLGMLVAALILAFQVGSAWLVATANRSTYLDNIYVNGIKIDAFTREAGAEYVRQQIDARLNATYTLTCGEKSWSICAADFGASIETDALMERAWNIGHVGTIFDRKKAVQSLKENPIELEAPLNYDESRVDTLVDEIYNAVYVAPQNAAVAMNVDQPYLISESSRGEELDREIAREQIVSLIETGEGEGELPMIMLDPALSTDSAMESMNLIVEYKTDTSMRGYNSRYNVLKALSYFSPMEVKPGEEVDFNAIVGPRTEERGWMPATEYIDNQAKEGYGGGVCQASSTLYGALLKAGMTIIDRYPHSMTVALSLIHI